MELVCGIGGGGNGCFESVDRPEPAFCTCPWADAAIRASIDMGSDDPGCSTGAAGVSPFFPGLFHRAFAGVRQPCRHAWRFPSGFQGTATSPEASARCSTVPALCSSPVETTCRGSWPCSRARKSDRKWLHRPPDQQSPLVAGQAVPVRQQLIFHHLPPGQPVPVAVSGPCPTLPSGWKRNDP